MCSAARTPLTCIVLPRRQTAGVPLEARTQRIVDYGGYSDLRRQEARGKLLLEDMNLWETQVLLLPQNPFTL